MRDLKASAIILIAYLLSGVGSLLLAIPPGFPVPVWLPSAVGLSAVLLIGYRALPAIGLGMAVLPLSYGLFVLEAGPVDSFIGSAGLSAAAVLQAALAKLLVRPDPKIDLALESAARLARLIIFGAAFATMCGAALAASWLTLTGLLPPNTDFLTMFARNWTGNAAAAAAVTPVILVLFAKTRVSDTRKRNIALVFVILSAISLTTFLLTRVNAIADRYETFAENVNEDHAALQERLTGAQRRLESLQGFFAASESVTEHEFATFVSIAFGHFESANSLHWLVSDDREAKPNHMLQAPLAGIRFDPGRRIAVAANRNMVTDYYFDDLPALIDAALTVDALVASTPNGEGAEAWVALAIPAFEAPQAPIRLTDPGQRLRAVAIGTFSLQSMLDDAFSHEQTGYDYRVQGIGSDGSSTWTFGSAIPGDRLTESRDLPVGGHLWRIDYVATDAFLQSEQDWVSWGVIMISLSFITVLNALALLATARTDFVQRLVVAKSDEASALSSNLSLILEHAADAIVSTDPDGRGVQINPAATKLLGYSADELTGEIIHDIIHPVDQEGRPHNREDCPMLSSTRQSGIERFRRKDGSDFLAEYSTETIQGPDGSFMGAVSILRDITERMQTEADRERFIERLTHANEELERFAFVASHDLQEPLRLISNFTGLLASRHGDKLDETGRTYIQHTLSATARMQALITDLLAYGRMNSDANVMGRDVDLAALITNTLDTLGPAVQAVRDQIKVGAMPTVRGNPARLGQLLQNLIGNAVKFQPPGQQAVIDISARDLGDRWEIAVADNGIGIKRDYREQIFKPFKRLHSPDTYPGSGMGLAICRKIVESHGGVLTMEGNEPHGSVFRFTLPKASPDAFQEIGSTSDTIDP